ETRTASAPWVDDESTELRVERDFPGDSAHREIANHPVAVVARSLDSAASKRQNRELRRVQEMWRREVCVALLVSRIDAPGVDRDVDRRSREVGFVDREIGIPAPKLTKNLRDDQVADREPNARACTVDFPRLRVHGRTSF